MKSFGPALRELRKDRGLRLGDVAQHLGFTVAYVSDVERGRRAPFADDDIEKLASLLEADAAHLRRAARVSRGVMLKTDGRSEDEQEAALALHRSWGQIESDKLRQIISILEDD